jgi:hypothetical protein
MVGSAMPGYYHDATTREHVARRDRLLQSFQNSRRPMTNLLNMLHDERASLARKLAGVDAAIHALNGSAAPAVAKAGKKRTMSAAARARISAAQKKRWAKVKK